MFIYNLTITIGITAAFYLLYSLFQSSYERSLLSKRLAGAITDQKETDKPLENKSQLTDILSKKLSIFAERIVPQNMIKNIERKIIVANMKDFDLSKYFLMKAMVEIFVLFVLPFVLVSMGHTLNPAMIAGMAIGGFFLPDMQLKSAIEKRHKQITKALPNFIDLLRLCIEAGLDIESAFSRVVREDTSVIQPEIERLAMETKMGKPLSAALRDMSERLDHPDFSAFVTILVQANEMGMSVGQVLRTQGEQISLKYMQGLRARAAKTPVLITLPLVGFILPALFLLLMGPAILQLMEAF